MVTTCYLAHQPKQVTTSDESQASLLTSNSDDFGFETIPHLDEIVATRRAVYKFLDLRKKPLRISCVFTEEDMASDQLCPTGRRLRMQPSSFNADATSGNLIKISVIGVNCTHVARCFDYLPIRLGVAEALSLKDIDDWPNLIVYPDGNGKHDPVSRQ